MSRPGIAHDAAAAHTTSPGLAFKGCWRRFLPSDPRRVGGDGRAVDGDGRRAEDRGGKGAGGRAVVDGRWTV